MDERNDWYVRESGMERDIRVSIYKNQTSDPEPKAARLHLHRQGVACNSGCETIEPPGQTPGYVRPL